MGTGKIVDFTQNQPVGREAGFTRVEQTQRGRGVEVRDSRSTGEVAPVEIRVHEETIVHGQEAVRVRLKKDGSPDLRFRNAPTREEWERIKRLEDR